ncbi:MAG TPA: hypothetical protein VHM30_07070, partial [Gemmatimonadaceae bacterium]|nr:hypothetical protein [Gemmatimonadaceae bacterium]
SALLVIAASPLAAQVIPTYKAGPTARLGREGGWDYLVVDTSFDRIYLSRGSHVLVVDGKHLEVVGDIQDTPGVHGIALTPLFDRGFISNGRDSSVTIFDRKTLATVGRVHGTGANPDAIVWDPASRRVFTMNGRSASASIIDATAADPAAASVVGTIALGGKPEFAVVDGKGSLWINIEDRGEIVRVDTRGMTVRDRWSLAPCEEPTGLALDAAHRRLFTVCSNRLMAVVDADDGKVVATLPIGAGADGVAFDGASRLAFSSNGEGTVTIVHEDGPDAYRVVQTVATRRGARTITLDPRTHAVYTVTADYSPAPAPTAENPRPRPVPVPGSFTLLVLTP